MSSPYHCKNGQKMAKNGQNGLFWEIIAKTTKIVHFGHFWPFFGNFCSGMDWTWVVHTFYHHILHISTYLFNNWCLYQSFQALKMRNNCQNYQNSLFWPFLAIFWPFLQWYGPDMSGTHLFSSYLIYIYCFIAKNRHIYFFWNTPPPFPA